MGADLCGMFFYAAEGTMGILKKHLFALGKAMTAAGDLEKLDVVAAAGLLDDLGKLGACLDDFDGMDGTDALLYLAEDLKTARAFCKEFKPGRGQFGYRDGQESLVKINGVRVSICFAGEMSYGEEPEGGGYLMLRALNRTGCFDLMYRAIPWDARNAGLIKAAKNTKKLGGR